MRTAITLLVSLASIFLGQRTVAAAPDDDQHYAMTAIDPWDCKAAIASLVAGACAIIASKKLGDGNSVEIMRIGRDKDDVVRFALIFHTAAGRLARSRWLTLQSDAGMGKSDSPKSSKPSLRVVQLDGKPAAVLDVAEVRTRCHNGEPPRVCTDYRARDVLVCGVHDGALRCMTAPDDKALSLAPP